MAHSDRQAHMAFIQRNLDFLLAAAWQGYQAQGRGAICIDQRELFRLGLLLDGIFGEENRLAVLNWQKSYSPRNDRGHVSHRNDLCSSPALRTAGLIVPGAGATSPGPPRAPAAAQR